MAKPSDFSPPTGDLAPAIVASAIYGVAYRLACLAEAIETGQIDEAHRLSAKTSIST